ncbi:Major Facilitator Superfamily [Aspergillus sclerotialis]|uniref:Major Facilitator Superfamily n=1 Tax=Aspergillus sclerotialis TaxID=2070753 RepID=A0A3A2ZMJ3_9EURO|nr:Major Facilitator Superfamily [Aspergillus sclerotialis]
MQTFVCGLLSYIILPSSLETAPFLTREERDLSRTRILLDAPSDSAGTLPDEQDDLKWSEVRRGILDPQLPTIIEDIGFAANANQVQLWSVIPYAVAAILTAASVAVAFASDWMRLRGTLMLVTLPIAIVGYAVIANIHSAEVKYGMTFLMATGMYSSVPCILVWNSNNSAGNYKRATTSALQLAIANCGGFVASKAPLILSSRISRSPAPDKLVFVSI